MHTRSMITLACAGVLLIALAGERPMRAETRGLSEGPGLAAKYPGDKSIEKDPAVLFAENFEAGSLEKIVKRWNDSSNKDGKVFALSQDRPPRSSGSHSLQMTATLRDNDGGNLYKLLKRGVDTAFARFYVKFAPDADYLHHFSGLGGYNPPTTYPQGHAGIRPRGDDRMSVGIEPYGDYGHFPPPGAWNFYTYWPEMKISADGKYWGNGLAPAQPALAPRGRWQCVEIMMKCNSAPDKRDGELALWLDGKLTAHFAKGARRGPWTGEGFTLLDKGGDPFEGFRWRTTNDLKINYFWLSYYVTENAARQNRVAHPKSSDTVWFDDIVVATSYIGPIQR